MKLTIHHLLLIILTAFAVSGCYEDDRVWEAIDDQQLRLNALEKWQITANGNIEALQVLLSGQDYITNVAPVILDGQTIGYTITFHTHAPITIYNGVTGPQGEPGEQGSQGEQGATGNTPVISVTQQGDGIWYWTLNDELLKDDNGNPIRANGNDGKPGTNGKPGVTAPIPVLKTGSQLVASGVAGDDWISEAIYLSVDGGTTWKQVSGVPGINNDAFFQSVDSQEEYVTFTLNNGNVITVPRYVEFGLDLAIVDNNNNNNNLLPIDNLNETILCHYDNLKLKCTFRGTESISSDVYVMARMIPNPGDWRVDIKQLPGQTDYYIELRCSSVHPNVLFTLLITVTDNAGHSWTYDLSIQQTND